jgi:ABC-2 type transport system permease protein
VSGTLRLLRLALRRDRVQLPVWILASAAVLAAGVAAVVDEFPDARGRADALRVAAGSPAVLLMRGTPVGTDPGALVSFRNLAFTLVLVALMSTFAVVRHTRQDEETGRAELVRAGAVGRQAPLAAALLLAGAAGLLFGLATTGTLLATGLPAAGSVAFGAACAVTGWVFAGLAAVAAQVFRSSRAANACAASAVGVAFLVRGVGDALGDPVPGGVTVASGWPSWLSPLGWGMLVRPFGAERWWVLALPVVCAALAVTSAFLLATRRDLGTGLVPDRPGPTTASRALLGPLGLAWRMNRATTIGWVLGAAAFGVGIGSLGGTVADAFGGDNGVADLLDRLAGGGGAAPVDAYYGAMMNVFGVLAAAFAVQALLRLRSEESGGAAEAVLSAAVGRTRWVAAHVACAVGGAAVVLLAAGVGAGSADRASGGDTGVPTLVGAALSQLPGALVVAGFVVLVFGGMPRAVVAVAWAGLAVSIACGLLGDLFGLPQAVRDVSPFSHVPALPAGHDAVLPLAALVAVAAVLTALGMGLFRRRDLVP